MCRPSYAAFSFRLEAVIAGPHYTFSGLPHEIYDLSPPLHPHSFSHLTFSLVIRHRL
jgi:hypothetical protein